MELINVPPFLLNFLIPVDNITPSTFLVPLFCDIALIPLSFSLIDPVQPFIPFHSIFAWFRDLIVCKTHLLLTPNPLRTLTPPRAFITV